MSPLDRLTFPFAEPFHQIPDFNNYRSVISRIVERDKIDLRLREPLPSMHTSLEYTLLLLFRVEWLLEFCVS
jgi:hypothetical protein